MMAPHLWPKPLKSLVLSAAVLMVILAYMSLCAGGWLATNAIFLVTGP